MEGHEPSPLARLEIKSAMAKRSPEPDQTEGPAGRPRRLPQENEKIRVLKTRANRGIFAMALFVALSIGAIRDFDMLPSLPASIHALLGHPPSANLVSAALLLYIFSAIILILSRMTSGSAIFGGFTQVAYLSGFYLFYHFSGAMEENFWAVFAAGMTILGLESYHLWTWCTEEIRKEEETAAERARKHRGENDSED